MADLVESQGGTTFLIQALNKLGVCSSHDTLKRFIQRKLDAQVKNHPCSTLFNSNTFTVISVDNIFFYTAMQGFLKALTIVAGMAQWCS